MREIKSYRLFVVRMALATIFLALIYVVTDINTAPVLAAPQTFTVNSTAAAYDSNPGNGICATSLGECTLQAAIGEANNNGNPADQDVINFNIPGAGVKTIAQGVDGFYDIGQSVYINGYSQPTAQENTNPAPEPMNGTLTIEIDGSLNSQSGMFVTNDSNNTANNIRISGLIINRARQHVFALFGTPENITIDGNYIGTDPTGMALVSNGIQDSKTMFYALQTQGLTLGGQDPENRNVFASYGGLRIGDSSLPQGDPETSSDLTVKGNNFFVGSDSVTPIPPGDPSFWGGHIYFANINGLTIGGDAAGEGNIIENLTIEGLVLDWGTRDVVIAGNRIVGNAGSGITLQDGIQDVRIGGTVADSRNVISDSEQHGIRIGTGTERVQITGNYIGVADDGITPLANGGTNILIQDSTDISIGGVNTNQKNVIANSTFGSGISMSGNATDRVSILGNSIYSNSFLGIDLGENGVTNNDTLDSDTGPNNLLNFPSLYEPTESGGDTYVPYEYDLPAGEYRIEFFSNTNADSTGYGEGEEFIEADTFTSAGSGLALGNATLTGTGFANIRATVTLMDGADYVATSEFSGPLLVPERNVAVTKTAVDPGTIASNGTIAYTVTYTNNGPEDLDVSNVTFDSGDPLNTALFNDIFPNNLTFVSATGDIDCTEENLASTFGTLFSAHSDYIVRSCAYDGVLPRVLSQGESLNFTLNFSVINPAQSNMTNYILAVPTIYDSDISAYEDAVDGGTDIINALGTSIDNLALETTALQSDISITKELLTAAGDVSAGSTLSYELTYTNNGADPLYLAANTPFASEPLFYDYTHPDLGIVAADIVATDDTSFPGITLNTLDVGNPSLLCIEAESPASGLIAGLVKYSNYGFVACWYVGSDLSLASDASLSATLNFDVAGDSDLDFANYAYAPPNIGGGTVDPDVSNIAEAYGMGVDYLDGLIQYTGSTAPINNFAVSVLPVDITVTSQIIDPPATISEGTPIKLEVTLANSGPASYNFSNFSGLGTALFGSLISGTQLSFDGVQDDLITCQNVGAAGGAFFGVAAEDHPNSELVVCNDITSDIVIPAGGSQSITLLFSAKSTVTSNFGLFSFSAPATDTDVPTLFGTIFGATEDILDTIDSPNYSAAYYSGTLVTPVGNVNNQTATNESLTSTGDDLRKYAVIAGIVLLTASLGIVIRTVLRKYQKV